MDRKDYENNLVIQSRVACDILETVADGITYADTVEALSDEDIAKIEKIILTGAGDSYCAGVSTASAFELVAGIVTRAMRVVEVARFVNYEEKGYTPEQYLVIGTSVSGNVSRVREALERANAHGANTLAATGNNTAPVGRTAKHIIYVKLPKTDVALWPGAINYSASMIALYNIALRIAKCRGAISEEEYADMKKSIRDFIESYRDYLPSIEEKAFEVAQCFNDRRSLDFIGDHSDYATAFVGSAKVLEAYGGYTTYDDSEDWNHINYFLRNPESIGRVIVANEDTPSFGRVIETANTVKQLGSPCMVVTDAEEKLFPEGFFVFRTPKPKYSWLNPLMQHFCFAMVAGYIAELKGYANFRTDCPNFQQTPVQDQARIRESKIEII